MDFEVPNVSPPRLPSSDPLGADGRRRQLECLESACKAISGKALPSDPPAPERFYTPSALPFDTSTLATLRQPSPSKPLASEAVLSVVGGSEEETYNKKRSELIRLLGGSLDGDVGNDVPKTPPSEQPSRLSSRTVEVTRVAAPRAFLATSPAMTIEPERNILAVDTSMPDALPEGATIDEVRDHYLKHRSLLRDRSDLLKKFTKMMAESEANAQRLVLEIADKDRVVQSMDAAVSTLRDQLVDRDHKIQCLSDEIERLMEAKKGYKAETAQLRDELTSLQNILGGKQQLGAALDNLLMNFDHCRRQLEGMREMCDPTPIEVNPPPSHQSTDPSLHFWNASARPGRPRNHLL